MLHVCCVYYPSPIPVMAHVYTHREKTIFEILKPSLRCLNTQLQNTSDTCANTLPVADPDGGAILHPFQNFLSKIKILYRAVTLIKQSQCSRGSVA